MKKILILIMSIICLFFNCSYAIVDDTEMESIPEYKEYFEEYAQRLYDNFRPQKHFFGAFATVDVFQYTIFRDGTVKNIKNDFFHNRYVKYCKKVIETTEAKPFPEAMKDGFIVIRASFSYYNDNCLKIVLVGKTNSYMQFYWKDLYNVPFINVASIHIKKKNYLHKFSK